MTIEGARPERSTPRQRAIALCVAVLVHAALLVPFLSPPPNRLPTPPPLERAVEVALIGPMSAPPSAAASDAIWRSLDRPSDVFVASQAGPVGSLSEIWGDIPAKPTSGSGGSAATYGPTSGLGDPSALVSVARPGSAIPGPRLGVMTGPPCWSRVAVPLNAVAILVLDERGGVIGRPRLTRLGGGGLDRSVEAQVMQALAGCAPFGVASRPGLYATVRLDFSRMDVSVSDGEPVEIR